MADRCTSSSASGVKSWEFRYKRAGKVEALVLGPYGTTARKMGPKAARIERDRLKGLLRRRRGSGAPKRKINAEKQRAALAAAQLAAAERKAAKAQAKAIATREAQTLRVVPRLGLAT